MFYRRHVITIITAVAALIIVSSVNFAVSAQVSSQPATGSSRIFQCAKSCVGKEMWKGYGLSKGTLGCAAALSNVLKKAGVNGVSTPLVTLLRRQLLKNPSGCQERIIRNGEGQEINDALLLKDCQPGDIVLAFAEPPSQINAGAKAHCGIMGVRTQVYTNNWMDGIWTEVEIHQMFDYYPYIRLLRIGSGTLDLTSKKFIKASSPAK